MGGDRPFLIIMASSIWAASVVEYTAALKVALPLGK